MNSRRKGVMFMDYFRKFKKRFFGFLKEFLVAISDEIKLVWLKNRIESLNEDIELDRKFELGPDVNKALDLEMSCFAYNVVLARVTAREEKNNRRKAAQPA